MLPVKSSSFLSSLRAFLSPKQRVRVRSKKLSAIGHQPSAFSRQESALSPTRRSAPGTQHFTLESLEPRLLLSGTPIEASVIQDAAIASFTVASASTASPLVEMDPSDVQAMTTESRVGDLEPQAIFTITIDATALTATAFVIAGVGSFNADAAQSISLEEGTYTYLDGSAAGPGFQFTVSNTGTVIYAAELDPVMLDGLNTNTLVVNGAAITIDATALSSATWKVVGIVGNVSTATPETLRLLTGDYLFGDNSVVETGVGFTVSADGRMTYAAPLEPILSGAGTSTLTVDGAAITIDAHTLGSGAYSLVGIFGIRPVTDLSAVRLITGNYSVGMSSGGNAAFAIVPNGTVDFAPSLNGYLSGRGTNQLTINGDPSIADLNVFSVTNTNDIGAGSFRQAILDANASSGKDIIAFNIGTGLATIAPSSILPIITDAVVIDGYTQSGARVNTLANGTDAVLAIELNGANAGSGNGLVLNATSSIVRGLAINGFNGQGVVITGSTNVIEGNFIGTNAVGTASVANVSSGVRISSGTGNIIGGTTVAARNVISGNGADGILIQNAGTDSNVVQGNLIGMNAAGTAAIANGRFGVHVFDGPNRTNIGGTTASERNVISGNAQHGIQIDANGDASRTAGNIVTGNYIGANAAGGAALANGGNGISINGAPNTIVGGLTGIPGAPDPGTGSGNVIVAGSADTGVFISGAGANNTTIQGNLIGLAANGDTPLGGGSTGIAITSGIGAQIGGSDVQARNVISGNLIGIALSTSNSNLGTKIEGNYIGTDVTGTLDRGNSSTGVDVGSAPGTIVGGAAVGAGNLISGNDAVGIQVTNSGVGVFIQGNTIGLGITGSALSNGTGVQLSANGTTVGGPAAGARNVISGNTGNGISISGAAASDNQIQGNYIGTNATGTAALPNTQNGVLIEGGANTNTVGGTTATARNVISGNNLGIMLDGAVGTIVQGNYIGTDVTGQVGLGNFVHGLLIRGTATFNTIGGTAAGAGNVIAGNGQYGVIIAGTAGASPSNNTVQGNLIGTNANGTGALPNFLSGVRIFIATNNTIGGVTAAARNVISGNGSRGVIIEDPLSTGNVVQGNYIGTNAAGTAALGNTFEGVLIDGGASNNTIGGTTAGARNIISGNLANGVLINGAGTNGNLVQGNYIGTNTSATGAIPNMVSGVQISNGASNNTIGGVTAAAGNVISGNGSNGVRIVNPLTTGNAVQGNYIGTNAAGTAAIANGNNGIQIENGASNNTIGGTTATPGTGAGNVISGNGEDAIFILSVFDNTTVIQGNLIGLTADGTTVLGNARWGVGMANGGARIGGTDPQARNVISANQTGILVSNSGSNHGVVIEGNYIGTDITGNLDRGNSSSGVEVGSAPGTFIGGTAMGAGNVIAGNDGTGIFLHSISHPVIDGLYNVAVQGNLIGLNATGTAAVANRNGINIINANNRIGGTAIGSRNVISGNVLSGIQIGAAGNHIQGNYIGTDMTGTADRGNVQDGISIISGASNNLIGGSAVGAGNVIAFNRGAGVRATGDVSTGNRIQGNSLFGNGGLGIDLVGTAGVIEPIDDDDLDSGPNQLQNVPQLVLVHTSLATTVTGSLNSAPNTAFTIELFQNATGTVAVAEAHTFLTRFNVATDANGLATFEQTLGSIVPIGLVVTATVTDSNGNTSEISTGVVAAAPTFPLNVTLTGLGSGRVTSSPVGIDSRPSVGPADLIETYPVNTLVTLTAASDAGSFFLRWTGDGIDSTSPTLLVPMDQARTITANFGLTVTEPVAPVPTGNQAASLWLQSVTNTWEQPFIPQGRTLLGYLVRVSLEDGVFTDPPIFVPATETSLTLVNRPIVPHFFTVSSLTTVSTTTLGAALHWAALLEPAAASGAADFYAVHQGGQFQTIPTTGVLANDTGVNLLAGFATAPQHGTLVFNPDGTFLYHHNGDAAASDSFTYRVDEGAVTNTSPQVTVTITIAQESGQSQTASVTPNAGLQGWTVQDESTQGGPSLWNGIASPTYGQTALIGDPAVSVIKPGTDLIQDDGLPGGRIDYTLTFTIKSDANGAVGVMFRYLDAQHYYRFSMFNGEGGQEVYRRLIKVTDGVATVLWEQSATNPGLPAAQWQQLTGPAYVQGRSYTLTIKADDLPQVLPTDPIQTDLVVQVRDSFNGELIVDQAMTDTQSPTAPLRTNGLALYSSRNPGSIYNLLSVTGLDNSSERALEVGQSGSGAGIIRGTVADAAQPGGVREVLLTPGSPVTSLAPNTIVTLTATPQVGGSFGGWTGAITVPDPVNAPHVAQVMLDQAIGITRLVTATFNGVPVSPFTLDVNGDGLATPQDAIVILRYLSLVSGPALTAGVVTGGTRIDPAAIKTFLDQAKPTMLDVNQDGQATPQDAIVILRHLSLVSGPALTAGVVTGGTQTDPTAIKTFLNRYTPGAQSQSSASFVTGQSSSAVDTLSAQPIVLSSQPSVLSPEPSAFDDSSAIAATQLSAASVQRQPWLDEFLGTQEDEEWVITV